MPIAAELAMWDQAQASMRDSLANMSDDELLDLQILYIEKPDSSVLYNTESAAALCVFALEFEKQRRRAATVESQEGGL